MAVAKRRTELRAVIDRELKPLGSIENASIPDARMIVDGLLPASVFGLVGPGGASKTTMAMLLSIHTILGRDWWGHAVLHPGPVIFYSMEDDRATFMRRAQQLCRAMGLNSGEWARVGEALFIRDLSGLEAMRRLIEVGPRGEMEFGDLFMELQIAAQRDSPSIIWMDPAIYFGPGEQHVNTGEAALMQAGRQLAVEAGAAVGFIHHTGKAVARAKVRDQYSGRGGSAFADNSRAMFDLYRTGVTEWDPAQMPGISRDDVAEGRVGDVTVAKLSYARLPQETYYWRHGKANWWDIELIKGTQPTPAQRVAANQELLGLDDDAVLAWIISQHADGRTYGITRLKKQTIMGQGGKPLAERKIEGCVGRLEAQGKLRVETRPSGPQGGKATDTFVPTDRASEVEVQQGGTDAPF